MKLRSLGLIAMLITSPAYADEAMTVAQDIASKWQTAYNSGDAGKIADLYVQDAIFSSGVLGMLKGKSEIEKALADLMKRSPKITINVVGAHQNGNGRVEEIDRDGRCALLGCLTASSSSHPLHNFRRAGRSSENAAGVDRWAERRS